MISIYESLVRPTLFKLSPEYAQRIADGPIEGLKAVVKAHDHALSSTLDKQLDYERDTQEIFLDREEFREGVKAFIEKRKPDFKSLKT